MANITHRRVSADKIAHHPLFIRGVRQKRLGKRVGTEDSMLDALEYEYGRLFAAMHPEIGVSETLKPSKKWAEHTVRAWNLFADANTFGTTK